MSEFKGAWVARPEDNGAEWEIVMPMPGGGEPYYVAQVFDCVDGVPAENVARLIAAAPELLEALQEACETIQDLNRELNNHGGMIDDETFPKGLAAIAKALGEGQ